MLCNRPRAAHVMDRCGFDALLALQPIHVLYLTDYAPRMMGARWDVSYAAVLPRREDRPSGLVVPAMELWFVAGQALAIDRVEAYLAPLAGAADGDEPAALPFRGFPLRPGVDLPSNVRAKQLITASHGSHVAPDAAHALARLVREAGLENARVAADDPRIGPWLAGAGLRHLKCVYEPGVFKEIRVVKTPAEIDRLRAAATVNEAACRAVAAAARTGWTPRDFDQAFAVACAERGSAATYLVVELGELPHGALRPGEPVMLDALSHRDGYHGDFGRTLVVGDPDAELRRRAEGLDAAWAAARAAIRPGADYAAIQSAAMAGAAEAGFTEFQPPVTHCVGLQHTDDPAPPGIHPGINPNRCCETGMVLNVDMPFVEWGWGTLHREDTVLVTENGCESLTQSDATLLVV